MQVFGIVETILRYDTRQASLLIVLLAMMFPSLCFKSGWRVLIVVFFGFSFVSCVIG